MAKPRSMEVMVGAFLLVCILLIAGLVIKFGKLERFSEHTYKITVVFPNVAGIVRDANVMYAGISVGKVRDIQFTTEEGELKVRVTLAIYEGYVIRRDSHFVINQSGLLGDRYVDIVPSGTSTEQLQPGAEVQGTSSVDLTEAMRSVVEVLKQTAGTIARIDEAVRRTDLAIKRFDEVVLTTQNLEHVGSILVNVDAATSNAVGAISSLHSVINDSRQSISNTLNTLSVAADDIGDASKHVRQVVTDNEDEVHAAARDLAASMARLDAIMQDVQKGQGTAGKLLTDPALHDEILKLIQNWRRYGILYKEPKPKPQK